MTNNTESFNKLVNDLIIYHQDLGLAICRPCGIAFPTDAKCHLLKHHKMLRPSERQELAQHIQLLPERRSFEEIHSNLSAAVEIEEIQGLPSTEAFKCGHCTFLGAEASVKLHCRSHGWVVGQRDFHFVLELIIAPIWFAQWIQTLHNAKTLVKYFPVRKTAPFTQTVTERQALIKATLKSVKEQNHQRHLTTNRPRTTAWSWDFPHKFGGLRSRQRFVNGRFLTQNQKDNGRVPANKKAQNIRLRCKFFSQNKPSTRWKNT